MLDKDSIVIEDYCCMMNCIDKIDFIKQLIDSEEDGSTKLLRHLSEIGVPCYKLRCECKSVIEFMRLTVRIMDLRIEQYRLYKIKWRCISLKKKYGIESKFVVAKIDKISLEILRVEREMMKENFLLDEIITE